MAVSYPPKLPVNHQAQPRLLAVSQESLYFQSVCKIPMELHQILFINVILFDLSAITILYQFAK